MAYLILVRHGQSTWNTLGTWTGWQDVPLSEQGEKEAQEAAKALEDMQIDTLHTSDQIRAKQTLGHIVKALKLSHLPVNEHEALKERDYGVYTGKNKWQVKEEVGEEEFTKIRRGWDHPIPQGESLQDVHKRVVPYYEERILNDLKAGKNVLVSSSGNTLRALVKHLEQITDDEIHNLEIGLGEVHLYEIDEDGAIISKEIRAANTNKGKI